MAADDDEDDDGSVSPCTIENWRHSQHGGNHIFYILLCIRLLLAVCLCDFVMAGEIRARLVCLRSISCIKIGVLFFAFLFNTQRVVSYFCSERYFDQCGVLLPSCMWILSFFYKCSIST